MPTLLQSAKNIISGKDPATEPQQSADDRRDRVDQVKVIWYQWANELAGNSTTDFGLNVLGKVPTSIDKISGTHSYDISNHIESVTYTKSIGAAAGGFSISMANSFDWSRFMKPGEWICIYFTGEGDLPLPKEDGGTNTRAIDSLTNIGKTLGGVQSQASALLQSATGLGPLIPTPRLPLPNAPDGKQISAYRDKLRMMGVISRVGVKAVTNADGVVELSYSITGKDFGVVYEETELWFNASLADQKVVQTILGAQTQKFARNLTELLGIWHDLFLNPNKVVAKGKLSSTSSFFPEQWVLPTEMVSQLNLALESGANGYFGEILDLKEFNPTLFENPDPEPLSGLEGFAWNKMKSLSQSEFHELFTELSDTGSPKVFFRPIPWAFDKSRYPILGKAVLKYSDLANPNGALPPAPINFSLSSITSFDQLASFTESSLTDILNGKDSRIIHRVDLDPIEVESFDVGPDYHNRYNFFLVSVAKGMLDQQNAAATISALGSGKINFPLRNENDIKRHGFKPLIVSVNTFIPSNASLFGKQPKYSASTDQEFILEVNEMMRDYHANAQDFYSGTIACVGKSDVKLGKVIVTDEDFDGIANMVFYIEGYTDTFTISQDGTGIWSQSISVTRGVPLSTLQGGNSHDKESTQTSTFNTFNKESKNADDSVVSKVKSFLKKPSF